MKRSFATRDSAAHEAKVDHRRVCILTRMSVVHFVFGRGADASGDLVFVHGLDGHPFATWNFDSDRSWAGWLAEDRPDLNIWTVEYEIRASAWAGGALPLTDRAINVLATLDSTGIGSRPLCFVTHSMGGLLVKQLLRHALDFAREYERIARHTRGVVFLATPHAGSDAAVLASYLRFFIRPTRAIKELEAHAPALRELNLWYRNNATARGIASRVFWETRATHGVAVVNATSADPGIPGVTPIPVDADHVAICKPASRTEVQYTQLLKFVDERLPRRRGRFGAAYFTVQQELLRQHTRRFVGRHTVQQAFADFMRAEDCGYFVVEGPPGQGKTALASRVVEQRNCPHHFFSRSGGRGDVRLVLASLLAQLPGMAATTFSATDSISELSKKFDDAIREWTAGTNGPHVIVLDGIDEIDTAGDDLPPPFLMLEALPNDLHYFVTSRPTTLVDTIRDRKYLVPVRTYALEPLTRDEVREVMSAHGLTLSDPELTAVLDRSGGNALYVEATARAAIESRVFDPSQMPERVEGYLRKAMARIPTTAIARDFIGFLATARMGLTTRQLAALMEVSERQVVEMGVNLLRQFLRLIGGRFGFYHQAFHRFATTEVLFADELREYHARIARWLRNAQANEEYRWSSLAYHLGAANDDEGLAAYITPAFLKEKANRLGYAVLEDLELLAASLLRTGEPATVQRCVDLVEGLRPFLGKDVDTELTRTARRTHVTESSPGVEACAVLIPRGPVTADFVELIPRPGGLTVAIGDAPATGLKSAFVARFVALLFRRLVENAATVRVARLLTELNRTIAAHSYFERVSMQCIDIGVTDGTLSIANAGHPYPALWSAAARQIARLPVRGRLLSDPFGREIGETAYEERHAEIGPADVVVLVSDGLTEDGRLDEQRYGHRYTKVVEQYADGSAQAIAERILDDWRAHPKPPDVADDVTVVVVRLTGESSTV